MTTSITSSPDEILCPECNRYSLELNDTETGPRIKCYWCEEVLPGICTECHEPEPCQHGHTTYCYAVLDDMTPYVHKKKTIADNLLGIQTANTSGKFSGE